MLPFGHPSPYPNHKKSIQLTDEQTHKMMDIYHHFSEAIRPDDMPLPSNDVFGDPVIEYTAKFSIWTRRKPRYHPLFGVEAESLKDVAFFGFDFRPQAKTDATILKKASRFIWHHKDDIPQPALLKAWMEDRIDIDGNSLDGTVIHKINSIFPNYEAWNRFHQYILDQKRAELDNIAVADDLLAQHKSGKWVLPNTVIQNCERFQLSLETMPDMRQVLAHDYVDFALPQIDNEYRPEINLKKAVSRKKISKRQLAKLEEIVIYLLPPAMRIGLTGKLAERQIHCLARAAKWLRPTTGAVWKKPWTDGLDLLALMVMDRNNPLELDFVRQVATYIHLHIDDVPNYQRVLEMSKTASSAPELKPKTQKKQETSTDQGMFRRILLNPDIKTFPGTDTPKDLVLTRMGILTADTLIDEGRLAAFEKLSDETYARRNDPNFWLMNQLDITVMLMNDVIDLEGHFIADSFEVTPFLRSELRHGAERDLWNKIAGLWLYPNAQKLLPETLTKYEAETLQIICQWLSSKPRRPRPFFWVIQDMVWDQFKESPSLNEQRIRDLALYIHQHRNDPPDFEALAAI